jgi:hypothetical protein
MELDARMKAFVAEHPFGIAVSTAEDGSRSWWGKVTEPLPSTLAPLVGDVAHNLRSALELLAWQLVTANGGTPGDQTSFPIARSVEAFEKRIAIGIPEPIGTEAMRRLRELRPYKGGDDRLYQLHRLNIEDKHRLLVPVAFANMQTFLIQRRTTSGPVAVLPYRMNPRRLEDGDHLLTMVSDAPFDPFFETEIMLEAPPEVASKPIFSTLGRMGIAVRDSIASFLKAG